MSPVERIPILDLRGQVVIHLCLHQPEREPPPIVVWRGRAFWFDADVYQEVPDLPPFVAFDYPPAPRIWGGRSQRRTGDS